MVNENSSCKTLVEGISFDVCRLQIGCTYTTVKLFTQVKQVINNLLKMEIEVIIFSLAVCH